MLHNKKNSAFNFAYPTNSFNFWVTLRLCGPVLLVKVAGPVGLVPQGGDWPEEVWAGHPHTGQLLPDVIALNKLILLNPPSFSYYEILWSYFILLERVNDIR